MVSRKGNFRNVTNWAAIQQLSFLKYLYAADSNGKLNWKQKMINCHN